MLILDEVLSVGDAKFRTKSLKKVQSMFEKGVTVLFVSHSIDQVKAICDTAILLDHGNIIAQGDVDTVSNIYDEMTRDVRDSKAKAMKEEKEILKKVVAAKPKTENTEAEKPAEAPSAE